MIDIVNWSFPLLRPHTGMMFGNGATGLLVWGEVNCLKITVGRADFWDHRGGMSWTAKQSYAAIRKCLENNDAEGIKNIFATDTEEIAGQPPRPSVIPAGRLEFMLPAGAILQRGTLNLQTGTGTISYLISGVERRITILMSMNRQEFCVKLPCDEQADIREVPSEQYLAEYFRTISINPPVKLENAKVRGWIQALPADHALCIGYRRSDNAIWGVTVRGNVPALEKNAAAQLDDAAVRGFDALEQENWIWWKNYWSDIPRIDIPNEKLDFIYSYGLYKFACFTNPSGIPATLQGPWIEEHRMPPWSSDYHFNINVQMCYWPAYKANRTGHLLPLFELILSWREQLRRNAKFFVGIDDGYILPHAVDDRSTCMGSFWTGTIDHACSAWVAQMMYQYYQYSGDISFLRDKAFDFMNGTMRVYEQLLEKQNGRYVLPVSVSPEYRGAAMNAWGANASFQLAAIRRLCEDLISAADILGETPSPAWADILKNLPSASLYGNPGEERIGLWDGTDLEESHRHHSHLGAICPFDAIDPHSAEWRDIVNRSVGHWITQGMGLWSGWCMPWASMLHSRLNNGRMAELILEIWSRVFTNEGYGTLHDVNFPGFSMMGASQPCSANERKFIAPGQPYEIMQMDAGMGAVTAVQDMLMHSRRGIVYVFPGAPPDWSHACFTDMPCEGGALISATLEQGRTTKIVIKAARALKLRLANPAPAQGVKLAGASGTERISREPVIEIGLSAGDSCVIAPVVCCQ